MIARLKESWAEDYARWQRRDLPARRYVYVCAACVYLRARMEPAAEYMLVTTGATPEGKRDRSASRSMSANAPKVGANY